MVPGKRVFPENFEIWPNQLYGPRNFGPFFAPFLANFGQFWPNLANFGKFDEFWEISWNFWPRPGRTLAPPGRIWRGDLPPLGGPGSTLAPPGEIWAAPPPPRPPFFRPGRGPLRLLSVGWSWGLGHRQGLQRLESYAVGIGSHRRTTRRIPETLKDYVADASLRESGDSALDSYPQRALKDKRHEMDRSVPHLDPQTGPRPWVLSPALKIPV